MFNNTKYTNWYNHIIDKSKKQDRKKGANYERHHILPKSLGGTNCRTNLVYLTFKEHYICHWLLTKMIDNEEKRRKMHNAFYAMLRYSCFNTSRMLPSWAFEIRKKQAKRAKLGQRASIATRIKQSNSIKLSWIGQTKRKEEMKIRMKKYNSGIPKLEKTKQKISNSLLGVKHPQERNLRKSIRQRKTWQLSKDDGQQIIVTDLPLYCKINNYSTSAISNLKAKRISRHSDIISAKIIDAT